MAEATYAYCIVKSSRRPSTSRVPGGVFDASRPEPLELADSLWLIAATVPRDVYSGDALEKGLSDLDWVGRIALAHEAVVEHFASRRGVTVVPMKLFTMFSSPRRAVEEVRRRKKSIERAFQRIGGSEEWGVRITRAVPLTERSPKVRRPSSGTAYLVARKHDRDAVRTGRAAAAQAAATAFDRLAGIARESRRRDDLEPSGAIPPLLDAAFLVPVAQRSKFTAAVRREAAACARAGAHVTLTGPWPAYNFVTAAAGEPA